METLGQVRDVAAAAVIALGLLAGGLALARAKGLVRGKGPQAVADWLEVLMRVARMATGATEQEFANLPEPATPEAKADRSAAKRARALSLARPVVPAGMATTEQVSAAIEAAVGEMNRQ